MKNFNWKSLIPHLIAIGVFLAVTLIFCKPALESGKVLHQEDMQGAKGMMQNLVDHAEKTGTSPLWNTAMFGGMPAYIIGVPGPWTISFFFHSVLTLGLPEPFKYFFLACICFYIFCMCIRIKPYLAIIGSLAFTFATFTPIIITVGHITQVEALAYAPALLGGIILLFERKYLIGFAVTALFTMQEISRNHQQVSYYVFLIVGVMTLVYLVKWIKEKDFSHIYKAIGLAVVAGALGVCVNAINLFTTYDYAKYSKRGGQLVLDADPKKDASQDNNKTKGLSREYAFQWSYGKAETFTLMFPGVMGYGARGADLDENSHIAKYLEEKANQPSEQAAQIAQSMSGALYWGDQPFTAGPVYLGAIVCFLFIFGLVYVKSIHKWWILIASVFAILLSWGHNFPAFNNFMFDYFPLYNKFRVPTMTLIIPQLLFPMLGVLALQQLISEKNTNPALQWKDLKVSVIATGAIFVIAIFMYMQMSFANENTQRTQEFNRIVSSNSPDGSRQLQELNTKYPPKSDNQLYENLVYQTKGNTDMAKGVVNALRQDRASVFGKDIFRALIFIALTVLLLGLFIKQKVNATILMAGVGILVLVDLFSIDKKFMNESSFADADEIQSQSFAKSEADETILNDKEPNFRVFNVATGRDPFQESATSYYHNSIGGYSPAKIGIFDDLITYQLSSGTPNRQVINMLNTKYVIQSNPQTNKPVAILNPDHLGNAWFVKGVSFVKGPAAEMKALYNADVKDSAIVEDIFKQQIPQDFKYDSTATIKMVKFDNDSIKYQTHASSPQVAVLSEIYYPAGWNAYIDGKKTEYFKTNYVLRGLAIPQGDHTIDFKFEPVSYKVAYSTAKYANALVILILLGTVFVEYRNNKKKKTA
ncbi:YfhO family protein [Chitinophagaceae bacterium LWZ2-11]